MKSIHRFALVAATCAAFSPLVLAEDAPADPQKSCPGGQCLAGGPRHHGNRLDRISAELGLSDQQKTQIQEVFKAHKAELQAIREDQSLTREQKMEKAKGVFQVIKTQAQPILTTEQQQKWEQMKEQFKEQWKEKHSGAPAA
jgi:G3E family GTPase